MRKIGLLSILIIFNCLLDSCSSNNVTCFNVQVASVENFTLDTNTESSPNDTIAANDYAILLNAESITETCMVNYSFGGSVLADEPVYILVDKLSNISIKSNADLNADYPAQSELKNLFTPISVDLDCLNNPNNSSNCTIDYFNESGSNSLVEAINRAMSQSLLFKEETDRNLLSFNSNASITSNAHEITVKITFESGAGIELKTEQIVLE